MDPVPAPVPQPPQSEFPAPKRQRSPWFYVALGCLGLALVICLSGGAFVLFVAKKGNDMVKGITDPATREENARKTLGGLPEGYFVQASFSVFGMMDMVALQDAPVLEDGGGVPASRQFVYFRAMGTDENRKAREYFTKGEAADPSALRRAGLNVQVTEVVKRGTLTAAGNKVHFVAGRGSVDTGGGQDRGEGAPPGPGGAGRAAREGLETLLLFECPDDDLHMAVWTQKDPDATRPATELELAGTVADEAALVKLLSPLNPCGR